MELLLNWLNTPVDILPQSRMTIAEITGFLTGLGCVWLTLKKSIWNFPVGIANGALLLLLFAESRLFADASLQILFILLGVAGWWNWSQGKTGEQLVVTRLNAAQHRACWMITTGLTAGLFAVLTLAKGSIPLLDALITALSLTAQWLLNQRKLESWIFWISVDLVSIPVYAYKQLYLIALLYGVFLGLAILGYRQWRQAVADDRPQDPS